ncbi:TIGR03013 family XrtA/PEP-CTERM system glycosyltransferase [Salinisphaera sp. Q1T1-3]|uniref:TIGR03013 family XrtA/PEP-CTERM system glycosyltransferase n=1 Tax=Salinisphaera sp. Q1T1-3 TaxID=2321229 RepID=UPI001314FD0D|nr:TIGR03013 family XrtA/PEP-CTERM system glycosyltransferase [Salinisphaera sp. Q1T1-3]
MNTIRLFNHHIHVRFIGLALVHLVLLAGSILVGAQLRFLGMNADLIASPAMIVLRALVYAALMMVGLGAMGLYRTQRQAMGFSILARVATGLVFGALLAFIVYYVLPSLFVGRGVFALAWLMSFLTVSGAQHLFGRYAVHSGAMWRVLFYGAGDNAAELLAFMRRRSDRAQFRLTGCVVLDGESCRVEDELQCRLDQSLAEYAQAHDIDEIVVAMDDRRRNFPADALIDCRIAGINVVDMVSFYERQTGRVKTELLQPSWIIFSEGFRQGSFDNLVKRGVDLVASAVMLAVLWPVMLVAMVAIKYEEGWRAPCFYRQIRVGANGRHFSIVKFRTMRIDAEAVGGAQWASENDPRITRIGHHLRSLRIDELPQIWNVFCGDMSLVGPRPERPQFVERLTEVLPYYRVRGCVRPGVTGWAQLCYPYGATEADSNAKLQFDLYYVKNRSLFLDLLILCNTIEVVLFRKGSR